jgi:hypothetical protein
VAEASGCVREETSSHDRVTCRGMGVVDGTVSGTRLTFADGSRLDSRRSSLTSPDLDADEVWVDYIEQLTRYPFQGSYTSKLLTIARSRGGEVLIHGRAGEPVDELDPATAMQLFGVSVRLELACQTAPRIVGCNSVITNLFEHVLETDPEQRVPFGVLTRVDTPGGVFDVVWATGVKLATHQDGCNDGEKAFDRRDFAAARR